MSSLVTDVVDQILASPSLSADELQRLIYRGGRESGPLLLATAYEEKKISDDVVAVLVGDVWSMAEYPDRALTEPEWRLLFKAAGFTRDGAKEARPKSALRLFRGSVPERRGDWSWTTSIAVAARYAGGGFSGRPLGRIWGCTVPPKQMLAVNTRRDEDEVVVDTAGLVIREVL